ncbi:MAG TPA: hypothetical protein PKX87_07920 [Alphaproteobacteria bacterium]|nr:hypothetical protein [Alphaproteobacteria bacterium]
MALSPSDGECRTAGTMPVWRPAPATGSKSASYTPDSLAPAAGNPPESEEEFGFFDLLDIVNPLQHLPIVSYLYREITDDQIKPVSQIAGGGLYGGLVGAAASTVNVIVEQETGKDIPGNLVSLVTGNPEKPSKASSEQTLVAFAPDSVTAEPLPDLSPSVPRDVPVSPSQSTPPRTAPTELPGTVLALADLRKPAMRSFVLNT